MWRFPASKRSRSLSLFVSLCLLLCRLGPTLSQQASAPEPVYSEPLGIALEGYPYPHPVHYFALTLEGQPIGLEDYRFSVPPQSLEQAYDAEINQSPEAYRAYVKRYFVHWKPEYEMFVESRARVALSAEFPRWAKSAALTSLMIYQQPVRHEFHLIQPPTLVVVGQLDRTVVGANLVSPELLKKLGDYVRLGQEAVRDIPHPRLAVIPNCGHIPHLEAPEIFHPFLLDFLKR